MEKIKLDYAVELAEFDRQKQINRRLWNVDETTAGFLYLSALAHNSQYLLELGTSNGYSTFWLSLAAKAAGGWLHTIEIEEQRQNLARQNLKDQQNITFHSGLAENIIPTLADGIDFVFIDAGKPAYLDYLQLLIPKLKPHALILADNILSHPDTTSAYHQFLLKSPSFFSLVIPFPSGLEISLYIP